jgi:ABC-type Na+ efflux pump permease subunit
VVLIAQNTLVEAARQRLVGFLVLLALGLVLGARWFRDFNFGAPELKFLADCGFGAMTFFGSALTIAATAQLFFSEIENRTVLTLLAKPVWRSEFILGKLLGVAAVIVLFCGLMTSLLALLLWTREGQLMIDYPDAFARGRTVDYAAVALGGAMQALKLGVLAALTLLVASFAQTQLFTVVTGFFVLVIGHVQYLAQESYQRSATWWGKVVGGGLSSLFPNFQLFAPADVLTALDRVAWAEAGWVTAYALAYAAVAAGLAIYSFRHREI